MPVSSLRCTGQPSDIIGLGPVSCGANVIDRDQLGLERMGVHGVEGRWVGIQDENACCDVGLSKGHPFVRVRHGEPIDPLGFKQPAENHRVGAVAQPLDDGNDPCRSDMGFSGGARCPPGRGH